jgi:hypothetical protein
VKENRYDQHCLACGWVGTIWAVPYTHPPCPLCAGATERAYVSGYSFVGDEIPGGQWVENLGHEPVFIESKSQLKHEREMRGLEPMVRHVGTPGSDKSPHTTKWI